MTQVCYTILLTGLLLFHLIQANDDVEISAVSLPVSSGGSRHRLSLHRKSRRRRQLMMDSLRSRAEDDEVDHQDFDGEEMEEAEDEEVVEDGERLLERKKKKKTNGNNKKKNGNNNNKKNGNNSNKIGNNKKRKKPNNNSNKDKKDVDRVKKNPGNPNKKKKNVDKRKDRKDAYYKASPDWCLCEDLYLAGWLNEDDYDDDWSYDDVIESVPKRWKYKNVRNKKRRKDDRLLMLEEDEQEELQGTDSEDEIDLRRHLKSDELVEEDEDVSLAEVFAAAEEDEEDGGDITTMTLRFKKRQNGKSSNKKNMNERKWNGNPGDWGDDEWGDDEWGGDDWGDDYWEDDEWSDDDHPRRPKWCPCPLMPTMMPTTPMPTQIPTLSPSIDPTTHPTMYPTIDPTLSPSMEPTPNPTPRPSPQPTTPPTSGPTPTPTTSSPTARPSPSPTQNPTEATPGLSGEGFFWGAEAAVGVVGPVDQSQSTPERFNSGITISNITAGLGYTLYLDISGNAFASGYVEALSTYKGQYGVGDSVTQGSNRNRQVNIVVRNGTVTRAPPFERVQAAFDHSAFIDRNGQLYMSGSNSNGKLCLGDDDISMKKIPHLVELPPNRVAVTVALGLEFTLILLDNGRVYGCGSNRLGEIGLGDVESVGKPTLIGASLGIIKAVSAGGEFSLFLTEAGKAYSSGSNLYKQQCRNTEGNPVKTPTEINNAGLSVLGIEGGSSSSYLLLTDGFSLPGIASCGSNNEGQLCGKDPNADGRTIVELDSSIKATGIGSGPTAQTVFFVGKDITDGSDVVYGCGQNGVGQVGIGSNQPRQIKTPTKVNFFGSQRFSLEISAATFHTVAIATDFLPPSSTTTTTTGATTSATATTTTSGTTTTSTQPPPTTTTTTTQPPPTTTTTTSTTKSTTTQPPPTTTTTSTTSTTTTTTTSTTTSTTTTALAAAIITDKVTLDLVDSEDRVGRSVAISGTSALIGAPDTNDDGKSLGAAWLIEDLFEENRQTKSLKSGLPTTKPTPANLDFDCGHSVALSNDFAVLGCPGFRKNDEDSGYFDNKNGAISVYTRDFTGTNPVKIPPLLIDFDTDIPAEFGTSVAINAKGIVAVGTKWGFVEVYNVDSEQSPTKPLYVLGNELDLDGVQPRDSGFGWSVALSDDDQPMLAVGAIKQKQNGKKTGSVFLWKNLETSPYEIKAPLSATIDCDDIEGCEFGYSVAFSGNTLVVGSPYSYGKAGRAFVYNDVRVDDFEEEVQNLALTANPPAGAMFGYSVAVANGAIVVGSRNYSVNDVNPGALDFFLQKEGGSWYLSKLVDDENNEINNPIPGKSDGDRFGSSVAINGGGFIVGAPYRDDKTGEAVAYSYAIPSSGAFAANRSSASKSPTRSEVVYLEVSDDCIVAYRVNHRDALSITVESVCEGIEEWFGIGFSSDGLMQNSEAVLGIPGNDRPIRYFLNGKSNDAVVRMPDEEQILIGASLQVLQNDRFVMKFTKTLESNEAGDEIFLLFARGATSTLGYHVDRTSVKITL